MILSVSVIGSFSYDYYTKKASEVTEPNDKLIKDSSVFRLPSYKQIQKKPRGSV